MRTPHTHTLPASVTLPCIPQVFVESLKLDIYQHELAIGKLFLIRRSAGEDSSNEPTKSYALHHRLLSRLPTVTCGARQTRTAKTGESYRQQTSIVSRKRFLVTRSLFPGSAYTHYTAGTTELKSRLLESLWHQDAIIGRSSGRGTEIFRQFRRLGTGWAAMAVYETWGDLFFEAYDPATTSTMTLEVSISRNT